MSFDSFHFPFKAGDIWRDFFKWQMKTVKRYMENAESFSHSSSEVTGRVLCLAFLPAGLAISSGLA
jgi:hypothetical protein